MVTYSNVGDPMDTGAWWATVHGATKSQTRLKRLGTHAVRMKDFLNSAEHLQTRTIWE